MKSPVVLGRQAFFGKKKVLRSSSHGGVKNCQVTQRVEDCLETETCFRKVSGEKLKVVLRKRLD